MEFPIDNSYFLIRESGYDPDEVYDIAVCIPYYLTGAKFKKGGTVIDVQPEGKEIRELIRNIGAAATFAKYANGRGITTVFFILDDCSPLKADNAVIDELLDGLPFVHVILTRNQGLGCKENILQYFAATSANYCLKIDADVFINPKDGKKDKEGTRIKFFTELLRIYEDWNLTTLSINASMPSYFSTAKARERGLDCEKNSNALGNLIFQAVDNFRWFGFTDWTLRAYEDSDIIFRGKYINELLKTPGEFRDWFVDFRDSDIPVYLGCTSYKWANANASGFGTDQSFRIAVARYYCDNVPYVNMPTGKNKKFTPSVRFNKKKAEAAIKTGFYRKPGVGPHAYAIIEAIDGLFNGKKKRVRL